MRHVWLILILIVTSLYSDEIEYKFSGSVNMTTELQNKTTLVNGTHPDNKVSQLEMVLNNDIYYGNTKLVISPAINKTSNWTYNNVIKKELPPIEMWYFNELYITEQLMDNSYGTLSASVGLFSFRKGTFYEYNYTGTRVGNGLFSNMDIMLQGGIITYKKGDNTLMVGDLRYERWGYSEHNRSSVETVMDYRDYKDSGGLFIMDKYQLTDKIYTEFNYYGIEQYALGKVMMNTDFYGLGLSYDDSENTGRTYYTILTFNKTDGDNTYLSPVMNWPISNKSTKFGKFENEGYSALVGVKQELDQLAFGKDFVIGGEVIYKSPGYHSLLAGNPFSAYSYTDIGYTYNMSAGVRLDKDTLFKLRYTLYNPDGSTKYGLSNVATDSSNVPRSIDRSSTIVAEIYFQF